ncbi:MAG: hypothetical protein WD872_14415 [Pirellulaceae bacterium]
MTPDPAPQTPSTTTLFQEVDIQRAPRFAILGTAIAQDLHYKLLSELTIGAADEAGSFAVDQVVRQTQLLKADELSRSMFEQSLAELKGWQFHYKLNARREIALWKSSPPTGKRAAPVKPLGAEGFLVTSVMDEDGWKELAQLSFIVPDLQSRNASWSRSLSHDFEPLGSWYGETRFTPQGVEHGVLRIDFVHEMVYTPPAKGKDKGALPFTIKEAKFRPEAAGGTIDYDTRAKRVQRAQEHFHVKGVLTAEVLGQEAGIEVEELQTIGVRLTEQNPWKR